MDSKPPIGPGDRSIPLGSRYQPALRHAPAQNQRLFEPGLDWQRRRREQAQAQESQMD